MRYFAYPYFISLLLLLFLGGGIISRTIFAQTYKQKQQKLEQKKSTLYKAIQVTEQLLNTTKADKKTSVTALSLLQNQIAQQIQVVQTMKAEINLLNNGIQHTTYRIDSLQNELTQQQDAYAQLVRNAYHNNNTYNKLLFLFSAQDFNDAYRRFKYMQYYSKYRKSQFKQVQHAKLDVEHMLGQLKSEQQQKKTLLAKTETERQILVQKEQEKEQLINALKKKETNLIGDIDRKRADLTELDQQIQGVIRQALAEARAKAKAAAEIAAQKRAAEQAKREAADVPPPNVRTKRTNRHTFTNSPITAAPINTAPINTAPITSTPITAAPIVSSTSVTATPVPATKKTTPVLHSTRDVNKLSTHFAKNKGKLPWPVKQGTITEKFGTNRHPLFKQITTKNNGINIATAPNSQVRALFEGQVVSVLFNPSFQWAVIINHGTYFTVYANLKEIFVNKQDKITTKQAVGIVYTNEIESKTEVHLEIWKESRKLNPAKWLYK